MPDQKVLNQIIEKILEVITPDKIILFGSRARGDARPDSDYDVLVIKDEIDNEIKITQKIYQAFLNIDELVSIDVVVASKHNVEKYKDNIGYILKPALKEGIVVYG